MKGRKSTVFDKLYFPKLPNYEYSSEYFASKATDAQTDFATYNCGDNIERNVEITNYLVRRHLVKTTKKLDKKRKEYVDKRRMVQDQWDELSAKEASLRHNFITFNQFVKENQEKKERAANKIVEQNRLKEEREYRMVELQEKCKEIAIVKTKMDKNIARYRIYEDFLLKVINKEESMLNINDLLKRYEALIGARKELNDIQQRDMVKLEKAKSNLKRLTERYMNEIATMSNRVNVLQKKYDRAVQDCKKWEAFRQYTDSEATQRVIDIVAIKESCRKMYVEICLRKKTKPIYIDDVEKQLVVIKETIGEYEIVNRKVKEMEEKDLKMSIEAKNSRTS